MKIKLQIFLLILGIFFLFGLSFIDSSIVVRLPTNYTNHTLTAVFNVSYINGTDIADAINATFYYNLSGAWTRIGSTSDCNNGAAFGSCNGSLTISGLTDGRYSIGAMLTNSTNNRTSLTTISPTVSIIFDSTPPNVSELVTLVNYGNYSSSIILNVSISDTIGLERGAVFFNITFSNGSAVNFSIGTASGGYYYKTIDTSTYLDGNYNLTIWANDSLNNLNNSRLYKLTFDNTIPTGGYSCSPSSVYVGDSVTCSCSGSDTTAGVNSTTFTSSPSTSNTGVHTLTCTITDEAGNVGTATTTYTVEIYYNSGSESSTTTTSAYTKTIPKTSEDFSQMQTIQTSSLSGGGLKAKERITIKLNNESHYIGVKTISSTSATIEIASTPSQTDLSIGEETKKDLDDDGYYDILVKLNGITNNRADLTISYIHEQISTGTSTIGGNEQSTGTTDSGEENTTRTQLPIWVWVVIGIVVLIIIGGGIVIKNKRK